METQNSSTVHKVLIGFKCSPSLRIALCEQAEKIGVTLSSHVETIVSTYKNKEAEIHELADKLKNLKEKIEFYENPFLKELFDKYKGQPISFLNRDKEKITITINDITDVFTIIINSFKIQK